LQIHNSEIFGTGDIVGCGINFPSSFNKNKGSIFFTKNGVLLGEIFLEKLYFMVEWFPVIGIDSFSPVEVNFGNTPFAYSIVLNFSFLFY
jgi:hypothetical protein